MYIANYVKSYSNKIYLSLVTHSALPVALSCIAIYCNYKKTPASYITPSYVRIYAHSISMLSTQKKLRYTERDNSGKAVSQKLDSEREKG